MKEQMIKAIVTGLRKLSAADVRRVLAVVDTLVELQEKGND